MAKFSNLMQRYRNEQEMLDYRAALICAVIANVNRDRKKHARAFQPKDFMPRYGAGKPLSPEALQTKVRGIMKAIGARQGKKEEKRNG